MKKPTRLVVLLFLCNSIIAAPVVAEAQAAGTKHTKTALAPESPVSENPSTAKIVQYGQKDVVGIKAKVRYSTLIVLPPNEQIVDFTTGDKDLWIINGAQNLAYVKPAKPGSRTNLNLITASGNIYSFVLTEVSELPSAEPDLKVFVEPKEESMISAANATPKFVAAREIEDYRQQVEMAKEETRQVKDAAQSEIDARVSKFISNMRFPYRFEAGKKPFYVRAMYTDDRFTYIQARPEETPTLYEIKDGQPNLLNFDYKDGVFVVDKILDSGYLVIGKQKLQFRREE
jgi:type IV secretion system protein VirB9